MIHPYPIWFALVLATLVLPNTAAAQDDDLRTIEFETTEVTAPDVAVSPDGEGLIFTMLGEKSTTNIAIASDSQGFRQNKQAATEGGKVAGDARIALERKTNKRVVLDS